MIYQSQPTNRFLFGFVTYFNLFGINSNLCGIGEQKKEQLISLLKNTCQSDIAADLLTDQQRYQLMMSTKQDSKSKKSRKLKESKQPEVSRTFKSPQKPEPEKVKTPFLRDLSPFSPIYRTIKKSYDTHNLHCDLAMIETPLNLHRPKSIIQEVEGGLNQISKLLAWEEEEYQDNNSGSVSASSSNEDGSVGEIVQQNNKAVLSAKKIQDIQPQLQSQIMQKAGEKIKNTKVLKKIKQKGIKIEENENRKKVTCNCKKTKCLKLYCDCFHENQVCGPGCNCFGCHNTDQYQEQRYNSMLSLMQRNPQAFRPKLEADQHAKGCNCKKSGCLKKYCECYQAGLTCGQHCKCTECKNCKQAQNSRNRDSKQDSQVEME